MKVSREKLLHEAGATGYRPEILEKVIQLLHLLQLLTTHPYLKGRWVLKGGTALNLFVFNVPRLSVDIDLNYIGSVDRETMLAEKPKVEEAMQAVFKREGFAITRQPVDHAGGKWRLRYQSSATTGGNLEVDLNFLLRAPLWPIQIVPSKPIGSYSATNIPVLDIHELAGGKLAALLSRHASRDLFDAHQLLTTQNLDPEKLRLAFVLYGAMNRTDWRTVSVENVSFEGAELRDQLIPVLNQSVISGITDDNEWARNLVEQCKQALGAVLPLRDNELAFLDGLLDRGDITPSLITNDDALQKVVTSHPAVLWKAQNVRQFKSGKTGKA